MQVLETPLKLQAPAVNLSKRAATDDAPWTVAAIEALMDLPFADLMFQAQTIHRQNFNPHEVEFATLLSVKTGGCPEDCAYCPQAARYDTGVEATKLMECDEVLVAAKAAKAAGAPRFCMGAARVRLSAGRREMGDAVQAMCFMAGANSIFFGEKLLTTGNPDTDADLALVKRLGMHSRQVTTTA